MGLREEIQIDIAEAFDEDLSDAVKSFTLTKYDRSKITYDPITGTTTSPSESYTSKGVFYGYSQLERFNTKIEAEDVKLVVLTNQIDVEPLIGDKITEGTNIYDVIGREPEPTNSVYILNLRKTTDV